MDAQIYRTTCRLNQEGSLCRGGSSTPLPAQSLIFQTPGEQSSSSPATILAGFGKHGDDIATYQVAYKTSKVLYDVPQVRDTT